MLLRIDHDEEELLSLERRCLMTTEEKEIAVRGFPFFKYLNNLNKYYTPYFETKLYVKG